MKRYFGTDGIRGRANSDLTIDCAMRLANALSLHYTRVFVGRDTRLSSPMFASAFIAQAMAIGMEIIDAGVVGTPCLCYALRSEEDANSCGVMITASHNPYFDNGLKVLSSSGEKLSNEEESYLEGAMDQKTGEFYSLNVGSYFQDKSILKNYVNFLLSLCPNAYFSGRLKFDGANGSAALALRKVATKTGFDYSFYHQHPNGYNINAHCGVLAIHEVFDRLKNLEKNGKEKPFEILVSLDGDGDRCQMILKDGTFLDGDALCYLFAKAFKEQGLLKSMKVAVTTMSSLGLLESLKALGIDTVVTKVGDRALAEAIREEHLVLGSEQSGHIILGDAIGSGDGIYTALLFFSFYHSFEEIKAALQDYKPSFQVLKNISFSSKEALANYLLSKEYQNLYEVFAEFSHIRVVIRPSGTEPILRVLFDGDEGEVLKAKEKLESLF